MTLVFALFVWVDGQVGVSGGLLMKVAGERRTREGHHPRQLRRKLYRPATASHRGFSPFLAVGTAAAIRDILTSVQPLSQEFSGGRGEGGHETILVTVGYILIFHG